MPRLKNIKNLILFSYCKIRKKLINDEHHISRFLKPSVLDSEVVIPAAFQYRRNDAGDLKEDSISVNWLEFFSQNSTIDENLEEVRAIFNQKMNVRPNARFAVLNVQNIYEEVSAGTVEHTEQAELLIKHTPARDDLSHSSIFGIPTDPDGEYLVATILAECANKSGLHKALIGS